MTQHGTSGLYRLTAALLAFVMLFAALPWTVAAQGDSGTAAISPADIPEGLTAEQLASHGAVSRLRQEETDEYTFVFLNNDGTRTSYSYGVPVKYADENGVMHDKNNTIKAFNSEYGNTAGDVELRFPQKLNKVRIGYKGHSIQISPVTEVSTGHISAVVSGNTVVYPGAFGQGIDLRYASVMSGIKEDIILQSYSGKNSFSFEIKTGGLALDEINGQYAITDGEEIIFSFGDLEVLDSFTGENEAEDNWDEHRTTAQGEIVTLKENDRYIFTVTVAEDFLTSPSTVYPVYIDPSFNVARQYITDTYIAQGYTNNYVNASLVAVGYGTNSKNIRTVAKITSLYGGNTVQGRITSAYYSMYCTSNYSSSPTVDAYRINDNISWNPSTATWQNSADLIMNNSTKISTLTVGGAGRYNFDITAAYQSWQMGQVNNGIMLRMTTEVSGKYRQFASANVSDSSKLAYITVTYDYSAIGVQLHETFSYMTIGQTKQLTALVYPAGMTELTWSSSNTSVAEVTSGGLITAKAAGSAVITARSVYDESVYAQCEIEVVAVGVSSVTLPFRTAHIAKGKNLIVTPLISPSNATVKTLNWYSNNTSVATVANGVITAVAPGTATITVHSVQGAKSDSMTVIVPEFEDGEYYLKNKDTEKHVDIDGPSADSGANIHQWALHGYASQKWRFILQPDGYYKIQSVHSGLYLSVSGNSNAQNATVIQNAYTSGTGQQWKVQQLANGAYKLTPKSGEADNRVLASAYYTEVSNGIDIQQRLYVDDTNYKDEWCLYRIGEHSYKLLAYNEYESDSYRRDLYFNEVSNTIESNYGNDIYTNYYTSLNKIDLTEMLTDSEIFIIHTHGTKTSFMISQNEYLTMDDIAGVNLNDLQLAVLLTCNTAADFDISHIENGTPQNIVEKMVCNGAETVIGFTNITHIDDCNSFIEQFMHNIAEGMTVESAVQNVSTQNFVVTNMIEYCCIAGNGGLTFG